MDTYNFQLVGIVAFIVWTFALGILVGIYIGRHRGGA